MGTLSDKITITRILETAKLDDGANLELVKYVDGGYGIARDCKPLSGLHWNAGQIEECLAEFSRLADQSNSSPSKAESDKPAAKKRILVVDDEVEITDMLQMYLERLGRFDVIAENHSGRVLKTARDFAPDLILMDVMMPEPDGSEVAAFIQEDPQLKHVPIIFVTALVTQMETRKPLSAFDRRLYLSKPIDFQELVHHIDETCQVVPPVACDHEMAAAGICG